MEEDRYTDQEAAELRARIANTRHVRCEVRNNEINISRISQLIETTNIHNEFVLF